MRSEIFLLGFFALCGCHSKVASLDDQFGEATRLMVSERYELALNRTEEGLRGAERGDNLQLKWRFRLLKADILMGRRSAADTIALLNKYGDLPNGPEWMELKAHALLLRGQAAYTLDKFTDAADLLSRAGKYADEAGSPSLVAYVELRRGTLLETQGNFDGAEIALQKALEASRTLRDPYLEARAASNIGVMLQAQSRSDEAISWFERSEALSRRLDAVESVARAESNLGACYARLGDNDTAMLLYRRAESAFAASGNVFEEQAVVGKTGNLSLDAGDYPAAVTSYMRALRMAREVSSPRWTGRWLSNLAIASIELGKWDEAQRYNDEAIALKLSSEDTRYEESSVLNAARIAVGRQQFELASRLFNDVERGQSEDPSAPLEAHAGIADLFIRSGQPLKAESEFRTAIVEINRRSSSLLKDEYRLSWLDSLIRFYREYVDFLVMQNQPPRALEIAESSRSHVLAGHSKSSPAVEGTTQQYQRLARQNNATLLEFWLGTNQSYLWVITAERIEFHTLPSKSVLRPLLANYSAVIAAGRNPLDVADETGRRLYDALIAPAVADVPGKTRFIIVPDEDLYSFNFESLPSSDPSKFWIEQATISIAPSLNYLASGVHSATPHGEAKLLLVGDPVPSLAQYPRLEYASREMDSIAATVETGSATVLKGAGARPDAYASIQPGQFTFIHFAAHASANRVSPLDSAVILSGPPDKCRLLARDVMAVPLNAELVTVSACRSAGGKAYAGEGLVGFAWAFLKAGAGNVIAGLWDVNDRSTTELMSRLYSEIAAGSPVPDALRTSKLALIHQGGAWAKPFYWAPFQLYTGRARM